MQKLEGSAALMALLLFEPFKPILLLFFLQSTLMLIMSMSEGGSGH